MNPCASRVVPNSLLSVDLKGILIELSADRSLKVVLVLNDYVIFVLYSRNSVDLSGNAIQSIFIYLFMWTHLLSACVCKIHK